MKLKGKYMLERMDDFFSARVDYAPYLLSIKAKKAELLELMEE